jgi:hypothetical protein
MRTVDDTMNTKLGRLYRLCVLTAVFAACGDTPPTNATFVSPVFGDECANFSCSDQGACMPEDVQSGPRCMCNEGYVGTHCEHCDTGFHRNAADECVADKLCKNQGSNPCGLHGECSDGTGVIFCTCDLGYEGPRCTLCASGYERNDDGECLQKVLVNGLTVRLPPACAADVCSSHGQCKQLDTTTACNCFPGYEGQHCDACSSGYKKLATLDRCEPSEGCKAPQCGGCVVFDGGRDMPIDPDTCSASKQLMLDDLTVSSSGGEGTLWLCSQSTRYPFRSEHVAVEAGSTQPARLEFNKPIKHITFDYVAWESFEVEVLGNGNSVLSMKVQRYAKDAFDLTFDPPIGLLGLRSKDAFAHVLAIDNVTYEAAPDSCP